jgi:capsule polysaccharide export protein KpsE/RkpR
MSDKEFKITASHNTLDMIMDKAFMSSVEKIEHPEISELKARVAALEQQLKAARKEAFIAGANEYHLGPEVLVYAENYAKQFEQG